MTPPPETIATPTIFQENDNFEEKFGCAMMIIITTTTATTDFRFDVLLL